MTCAELSTLISRRLMARARQEPDPMAFVVTACARMRHVTTVEGLIQFGAEMDILSSELKVTN